MAAQSCFLVTVLGGTALEVLYNYAGMYDVIVPWVPIADHFVALPSLAAATLSGVAMSVKKRRHYPIILDRSMQTLNVFGIYWVVADKLTQNSSSSEIAKIRTVVNSGACAIAMYMLYLMKQLCVETKKG
jgi:hypothetical protein